MDKNLVNLTPQVFAGLPSGNDGQPAQGFHELALKHKKLVEAVLNNYKVYKNIKESVSVEAESAAKALEASGIKNPYKIIRTRSESNSIIDGSLLVDG